MDLVALSGAGCVVNRGIAERSVVARASAVDEVLDNGGVGHGQGSDPEAKSDTVDGREVDLELAHQRVDEAVQNGDEDDDGDGIEVLHKIVGNTVSLHLAGCWMTCQHDAFSR